MQEFQPRRARSAARIIAPLLAAVLAAGTVSACGQDSGSGASSGPVTLRFSWWGSDVRAGLTTKAIKEFEAKHKNITVQTDYAAYPAYWQKMATETAGGNAPDVIQMDYRYVTEYGKRHVLADLGKQSKVLPLGDLEPAIAKSGTVDGKVLSVPFGQNTSSIAVDTTALGKLSIKPYTGGGSWADFAAWAKSVHDKSGGKVYGVSDMGYAEDIFELWLRQSGKSLYDDSGKIAFTKDDIVTFWTLWQGMVKSGAATPAAISNQYDGTAAKSALVQGKSAAEFIFDNTLGATQKATKNTLALAAFPTDGSNSGQYYKPTLLLSATAGSKHPAEAAELISFLINDEGAGKILGVDRGLPPNKNVAGAVTASLTGPDQVVVNYEKAVASSLAKPPAAPPKGDGQVKTAFQTVYQGVTSGKTSIADGAATLFTQIQQAIGA
ncbi:MAG: ABC-type sugar transport system, periplasmic component [Actinomycetia bacterium]|jgi:multiple sugar transport system substrate-binding protein|nr:ABC-type sugar transport system, periplasmic component [Actinomycetes bacterium]MDQ1651846.1 pectin-derived oligosaccharide transport system substrate-binding protein [Cryptosporangiaceae bacterium]MDQ1655699.1 pectin-derived oligosaccharide transport system substrate-binding protein [Cryptosporangiaceae bacterium]